MIVEGYAALFGVPDQVGDIVRAGAFRDSIARQREPLPMLVEHENRLAAGSWDWLQEDARGLFVRGEIRDSAAAGLRAKRMLARGVNGLSIGFIALAASRIGRARVLEAIDLLEVSIVTHPMQPQARLALARGLARAA